MSKSPTLTENEKQSDSKKYATKTIFTQRLMIKKNHNAACELRLENDINNWHF